MGKMKVYELAKELGITNTEVIERLKKIGVEVKSHLSVVEDEVVGKLKKGVNKVVQKKSGVEKNQMHIIRRNVKVINTEGDKKEVEQITTDISGAIKKSHHTVDNINKSKQEKRGYNRDGMQQNRQNRMMNKPRFGTRPTNVVITRNGKPIEKTTTPEIKKEINKSTNINNVNNGNIDRKSFSNTQNNREKSDNFSNNNSSNSYRSNNKQNYSDKKPFSNNNQNRRNGNNNSSFNKSDRPYKNNNGGYSNNRGNNYRNAQSNTAHQVNKFIKQFAPAEQKETREYENNIIDKRKYNDKNSLDNKKDKLDKNKLRERNTRISTSKLKGLEVDSGSLMDLYERDSDLSRSKGNKKKKQQKPVLNQTKIIPMTEVKLPEIMTVKEFAESIKKQASEVIKKLFNLVFIAIFC